MQRVAIGKFDCVHKGHRQLLRSADVALVITKNGNPPLHKIKRLGIKKIVILKLDEIKNLSYEDFFNAYIKEMYSEVVIGFNFRFGKNRLGNAELLSQLCSKHDIKCKVINPILLGGKPISSTRIKHRFASIVKHTN